MTSTSLLYLPPVSPSPQPLLPPSPPTFQCSSCSTDLPSSVAALLHLANQGPDCSISCCSCSSSPGLATLRVGSRRNLAVARATLELHLVTRQHIAAIQGEVEAGEVGRCDPCDVTLATGIEVERHVRSESHRRTTSLVTEYLAFCEARLLSPTSHRAFPSFVFFLRVLASVARSEGLDLGLAMEVLARIHTQFNSLLNVNESADVRQEVIR